MVVLWYNHQSPRPLQQAVTGLSARCLREQHDQRAACRIAAGQNGVTLA